MIMGATARMVEVPRAICAMIDDNLPQAVTYRRRDYEQASMMRELCRRRSIPLPSKPTPTPASQLTSVSLVYASHSSGGIVADIKQQIGSMDAGIVFTEDETELASTDRVLLFLSRGVLEESGAPLRQLCEVLRLDKASGHDRLVCAYSEQAGWEFDGPEQRAASAEVQAVLNDHVIILIVRRFDLCD